MTSLQVRRVAGSSTSVGAEPGDKAPTGLSSVWVQTERMLAIIGSVVIPARLNVWHLVTLGDLLALATAPLWIRDLCRYRHARLIFILGGLTVPVAAVLSWLSAADHEVRLGIFADAESLMVGMLASVGFLLWARGRIAMHTIVLFFGIGGMLGISSSAGLYTSNPWRFGFSVPVTVLALGVTWALRNRFLDLAVVLALTLISALTDARSSFALLLLTAILLLWQMRPVARSIPASATRAILGIGVVGVVVYNLGVVLITSGVLGVKTQQRSLQQIHMSGSLILGGRPEISATLALIRDRLIGFGSGTLPNYADVLTVKEAMSRIHYNPNNGYVEHQMLGHGFALHSAFGDLWAQAGLAGLLFILIIALVVLHQLGHEVSHKVANGILIYLSAKTLWNVLFAPWYSSVPITTLVLVVCLADRFGPSSSDRASIASES